MCQRSGESAWLYRYIRKLYEHSEQDSTVNEATVVGHDPVIPKRQEGGGDFRRPSKQSQLLPMEIWVEIYFNYP